MKRTFIYCLLTYAIFSGEAYTCDDPACVVLKKNHVYITNCLTLQNRDIPESWSTKSEPCYKKEVSSAMATVDRITKSILDIKSRLINDDLPDSMKKSLITYYVDDLKLYTENRAYINEVFKNIKEIEGNCDILDKSIMGRNWCIYNLPSLDIARELIQNTLDIFPTKKSINLLEIGAGKGWLAQAIEESAIEESGKNNVTIIATDINGYEPQKDQIGSKKRVEKKDFSAAIEEHGAWADVLLFTSIKNEQSSDLQKALENWPSEKPILMAGHETDCIQPCNDIFEDSYREITQPINNWALSHTFSQAMGLLLREAEFKNIPLPDEKSPDGKALSAKNGNFLSSASLIGQVGQGLPERAKHFLTRGFFLTYKKTTEHHELQKLKEVEDNKFPSTDDASQEAP